MKLTKDSDAVYLELFAFKTPELLEDLRDCVGENDHLFLKNRGEDGVVFGRGKLDSVHVIHSVRCFRVTITRMEYHGIPSGREKSKIMWVTCMSPEGPLYERVSLLREVRLLPCFVSLVLVFDYGCFPFN